MCPCTHSASLSPEPGWPLEPFPCKCALGSQVGVPGGLEDQARTDPCRTGPCYLWPVFGEWSFSLGTVLPWGGGGARDNREQFSVNDGLWTTSHPPVVKW